MKKKKLIIIGTVSVLVLIIGAVIFISKGSSEKQTINFTLKVIPSKGFMLVPEGDACEGDDAGDGYNDISSISQVVVRNSKTENVIERAKLGSGTAEGPGNNADLYSDYCTFNVAIELEKGSDGDEGFLFEMSDNSRGSVVYSWDELKEEHNISLSLGG